MTIVVGYAPSTQGRAALRAGIRYAERTGSPLLVAAAGGLAGFGGLGVPPAASTSWTQLVPARRRTVGVAGTPCSAAQLL